MSWGRLDDGLHDHEKFMGFGPAATPREQWIIGLSWTHRNYRRFTVPGFVPGFMVAVFAGTKAKGNRFAGKLVEAGLWEVTDGGWLFHDWLDYASPDERAHFGDEPAPSGADSGNGGGTRKVSPETLEKLREAGRRGGKKSAEARRKPEASEASGEASEASGFKPQSSLSEASEASGSGIPEPEPEVMASLREASRAEPRSLSEASEASGREPSEASPDGQTLPLLAAVPDPEPPKLQGKRTPRRTRTQGTRIPDDWQVSARLVEWTRTKNIPDNVGRREAEKFKDWWLQSTKPDAEKNDWDAAYRTWINRYLDKQAETAAVAVRPAASKRNPAG